jgi:DUF4097 and DUF4098 domain-containing protein YvlB
MMRKSLFAVAILVGAAFTIPARADEWHKSYTISGHAQLRFMSNDGGVDISSREGKEITARVETTRWRIDPSEVTITEHQNGDSVEIEVHVPRYNGHWFDWTIGNDHRSVRIELTVPRQADIDLHTGDGHVNARDITGNIRLDSGDGAMRTDNLHGTLHLHTGDGRIEGSMLEGALYADTRDGHISVSGKFDHLEARSGDGHIQISAEPGSKMAAPWDIHTGDGRITLAVPNDFGADLDAHTGDGRITVNMPITMNGTWNRNSVRGKLNSGGQPLTIRSGDGSISIEKL